MRKRPFIVVALVGVVVTGIVAGAFLFFRDDRQANTATEAAPTTTAVKRETLTRSLTTTGDLHFGKERTIGAPSGDAGAGIQPTKAGLGGGRGYGTLANPATALSGEGEAPSGVQPTGDGSDGGGEQPGPGEIPTGEGEGEGEGPNDGGEQPCPDNPICSEPEDAEESDAGGQPKQDGSRQVGGSGQSSLPKGTGTKDPESKDGGDSGSGMITWLPPIGSTIDRGGQVFRINEKPTVLLFGALPFYRDMAVGVKGRDVTQLKENLEALGHSGLSKNDRYDAGTLKAVKAWQKASGLDETGSFKRSHVVIAPGPVRVSGHGVEEGASPTSTILKVTGIARVFTVKLTVSELAMVAMGSEATIELPDGTNTSGTVVNIGQLEAEEKPTQDPESGAAKAPVTISGTDPNAFSALGNVQVNVKFKAETRADILTVPVSALLALSEGGHGVEVVDGRSRRIVAVETGMFADGRVEITGDIVEGAKVVVPS